MKRVIETTPQPDRGDVIITTTTHDNVLMSVQDYDNNYTITILTPGEARLLAHYLTERATYAEKETPCGE